MAMYTKEIGRMTNLQGMENNTLLTKMSTKDSSKMALSMAKACSCGQTDQFTKATGVREKLKEEEYTSR